LKYVILDDRDLELNGENLNPQSLNIIEEANKAKILLIFRNLSPDKTKAALKTDKKPSIFISNDLLPDDCIGQLKAGRHALGLVFQSGESPEDYFNRVEEARQKLGFEHIILWNQSSLWEQDVQAKYLDLFSRFIKAGWTKEDESRRPIMSKMTSGNFVNILRMLER